MHRDAELAIVRRAYAKQILAVAQVDEPQVEEAFATIHREDFLGPGPWPILRWESRLGLKPAYVPTPQADPIYLYTNDLVGIIPERQLNNGQPSFHAGMMASALPRAGEHVVHIGTGVGYYTAILAHMVGPKGRTTGIEFDPALAKVAKANFKANSNVEIIEGDGSIVAFEPCDVIYVNAGATRPADTWLDRLKDGGRLILPLTINKSFSPEFDKITPGVVFLIERGGDDFHAKVISSVAIFPCAGARDSASEKALAAALEKGGAEKVTRLYRDQSVPEDQCWLRAPGWSLAFT
jgi:protein-L-isoaspartate(D-aspartate) O-methyltransferase